MLSGSATFHSWNAKDGEWNEHNYYPAVGAWKTTRAVRAGDNMVVYILEDEPCAA